MANILLVEDEINLGATLRECFRSQGFQVTWVQTQQKAWEVMRLNSFDLAVLDIGLPDGSGFEVAHGLRKRHPATALLFLTAFGNSEDRIQGLQLGAEDYVVKPFHLKELLLRMKNILKRVSQDRVSDVWVSLGKGRVHFLKFEAEVDGQKVPLSQKEVLLLGLLVKRRGCVVSRDEILNHAWSEEQYPTPRTVDNYIMRLRRLLEVDPENPQLIKSIRGVGYQLL